MLLPAGLRALGQRDYRVYFIGTLIGQTGIWMQTVTQSWLVLQLTNSPFLLGLTSTLQFGPILLFSLFTGVLADRVTRRTLLFVTQSTQCVLALTLGLLVWSGYARYWHVLVVAVIWGVMSSIDQPARQSLVMELVGREHVTSAVGLNSASFNGARIIGPSIAGILIARVRLRDHDAGDDPRPPPGPAPRGPDLPRRHAGGCGLRPPHAGDAIHPRAPDHSQLLRLQLQRLRPPAGARPS